MEHFLPWVAFLLAIPGGFALGKLERFIVRRIRARRRSCQPSNAAQGIVSRPAPPAAPSNVVNTCLVCGKDCTSDPAGHAALHGFKVHKAAHVQSDLQRRPFKVVGSYKGGRS